MDAISPDIREIYQTLCVITRILVCFVNFVGIASTAMSGSRFDATRKMFEAGETTVLSVCI